MEGGYVGERSNFKKIPAENEDSDLKSGSRERCLPQSFEALNIRFNIRFKKKYFSQSSSSQKHLGAWSYLNHSYTSWSA